MHRFGVMRISSLFILLFLFSFKNYALASDCLVDNDVLLANAELLRLSCLSQDISKAVLDKEKVVPSMIYNYGKRKHLDVDIKEKNVPLDAWTNGVMAPGTGLWKLNSSRRGLYGTSGLDTNWYAGGPNENNWLMQIKIKEECRDPARVFDLSLLDKDTRFIEWFDNLKSKKMTRHDFFSQCKLDEINFSNEICDEIVNQFLNDKKISVVHDHLELKSFYIRDRDCIETIKGTEEDWFNIFADQPNLWVMRCNGGKRSKIHAILLQALALAPGKIPRAKELLENVKLMGPGKQDLIDILTESIKARVRCEEKDSNDLIQYLNDHFEPQYGFEKYLKMEVNFLKNLCL